MIEFQDWLELQMEHDVLNTILLDFLMAYPNVYNMYIDNDETWVAISIVLDLIPDNKEMTSSAFGLYCNVLEAMECFKKVPMACENMIEFLRDYLTIIKGDKKHISKDDILDLKIALETSKGVRDFIKKM